MDRIPQRYARGELVVVIDCRDLDRAARFWAAVLGYRADEDAADDGPADDGAVGGGAVSAGAASDVGGVAYRSLYPADGRGAEILLQRTADTKAGKTRLHLDLRTQDLDAEVGRVTALGATVLTGDPVREHGWTWHVLADPDGNEFCVLRPPDAYWPAL